MTTSDVNIQYVQGKKCTETSNKAKLKLTFTHYFTINVKASCLRHC